MEALETEGIKWRGLHNWVLRQQILYENMKFGSYFILHIISLRHMNIMNLKKKLNYEENFMIQEEQLIKKIQKKQKS